MESAKETQMFRRLTPMQWRIFIGCTLAYAVAYIGRLNMSAALPAVERDMQLTGAESGMLQTLFALTYACGQMVNGTLIDHVRPQRFISAGLLASALCNTLFGSANSYDALRIAWCLNGFAQSMLWTPVVRLVAMWFTPKQRPKISLTMSIAMIGGHLAAWAISGYVARIVSWRFSFYIPAAIMAATAIGAALALSDRAPAQGGVAAAEKAQPEPQGHASLYSVVFSTGLWIMLIVCVCNGFVRDSAITWSPTIIDGLGGLRLSKTAVTLLIPVADCIGILFIRFCQNRMHGSKYMAILISMVIAIAMAVLLLVVNGRAAWVYPAALAVLCAVMYGINPLLTMLIPMDFQSAGRVGFIAGQVDCCIYLGSSLAGTPVGALRDAAGWNAVFTLLAGASLLGFALCAISLRFRRRTKNKSELREG